jgi:hypothetical protein
MSGVTPLQEQLDRIEAMLTALMRDRCNARGYHVSSADGTAKFRYDQSGVCLDCGVVPLDPG